MSGVDAIPDTVNCVDTISFVDFAAMVEKLAPQPLRIGFLAPSSHCHHPPFRGGFLLIPLDLAAKVYPALVVLPNAPSFCPNRMVTVV